MNSYTNFRKNIATELQRLLADVDPFNLDMAFASLTITDDGSCTLEISSTDNFTFNLQDDLALIEKSLPELSKNPGFQLN